MELLGNTAPTRTDFLSLYRWISSSYACGYKDNFQSGVKDKGKRQGTKVFSRGCMCGKNLKEQMLGGERNGREETDQ